MNISSALLIALAAACVFLFLEMLYCNKEFKFPLWKVACFSVYCIVTGTLSVKIMYFIENGNWSGLSFFGGVLFMPVFLFLFALLFRLPFLEVSDMFAPGICIVSAVMKVQCLIYGCCTGIYLFSNKDGIAVHFPSRETEMAFALLLMIYLIRDTKKGRFKGKLYPLFMILYGAGRFLLNFFRDTDPFVWILPGGHFWGLISVALGFVFLGLVNKKQSGTFSLRLRDQ